jgi:hypothetical protein
MYYRDSLRKEYNEWPFYYLSLEGYKVDGQVLIGDLNILYKRYQEYELEFEIDKQYQKIISKANSYYDDGLFLNAKDLYSRALSFKSDDVYVKKQIKKCEKQLR